MSFILAPGSRTGVYYLIFAGLHRSATWKDVKDYLRDKHIEANHVEVYQNFLGGWVRVLGLECYEQLCSKSHTYYRYTLLTLSRKLSCSHHLGQTINRTRTQARSTHSTSGAPSASEMARKHV